MEVFYSPEIKNGVCVLPEEESAHCVRVLRHREGDEIFVIDGLGTLYTCRLTDASSKAAVAQVLREEPDWGAHPYFLEMAVCPTKNNDRYEWFAEKATELGLDVIAPVIGDHSERKVFKSDRLRRILLAASKQSLKGAVPVVQEPVSVRQYIANAPADALKLICCCFEGEVPRTSINDVLDGDLQKIIILIGPEGDFSREEAALAVSRGFIPVHLGPSRLRTETAALTAVEAVYLKCI
ncbi:MAG: 16S rRNA (uracil(1498)-N(3))-methyltransferase [Bacteroidales bacterium]|nr:16S rRNA (uracil(1498)-N(3))-methyltransferase [Bacteroidales bacterium]